MEEYLEIYDENNQDLNQAVERNIVHEKGLFHREISVWILNEKNEFLIQKRASTKKNQPNKWALCAGHIDAGETEIEAALREVEEEVGIQNLKADDFILYDIQKHVSKNTNDIINNHFKYCYILRTNLKENDFIIQKEELSEVKYITFEELFEKSEKEPDNYVNSLKGELLKTNFNKIKEKLKELKEDSSL